LTVRIAYNLFTQRAKQESRLRVVGQAGEARRRRDVYRNNGAGEMLVYSAADFEDFRAARPEMPASMEGDLERVIRLLAEEPLGRGGCTPPTTRRSRGRSTSRAGELRHTVAGLNWFIDHAETIDDRNNRAIAKLGGGIAVQHRMAYQGEYFVERYGAKAAERAPPIRRMLASGVPVEPARTPLGRFVQPVGVARLARHRKTLAGTPLYPRPTGWTATWRCGSGPKRTPVLRGARQEGANQGTQLADLAVLSQDYSPFPRTTFRTRRRCSRCSAASRYTPRTSSRISPAAAARDAGLVSSAYFGGYQPRDRSQAIAHAVAARSMATRARRRGRRRAGARERAFWGALGCSCWHSDAAGHSDSAFGILARMSRSVLPWSATSTGPCRCCCSCSRSSPGSSTP